MLRKVLVIILTYILILIRNSHQKQQCNHDIDKQIQTYHYQYKQYFIRNLIKIRKLQQKNPLPPQQIRITTDLSLLDPLQQTNPEINIHIKSLIETSIQYFQNLIKVTPSLSNNIFPNNWPLNCLNITVPQLDYTIGIPNSDLHIYITYIDSNLSNSAQVLASATFCSIDPIYRRPNFGVIQYNIAIMKQQSMTNKIFKDRLEVTIHEILHILGFSQYGMGYWVDPQTNNFYLNSSIITKNITLNNITNPVLISSNVLQTAQKYYNCSQIQGMKLENQGSRGTYGSHWERSVLFNEVMVAETLPTQSFISIFTSALLRDTGFYQEINDNFVYDKMRWGNQKGCDFFNNTCRSSVQIFPEFINDNRTRGCTFENDGYGVRQITFTMDGCTSIGSPTNSICFLEENNSNTSTNSRFETFGPQSRCLQSNLRTLNFNFTDISRCHQIQCANDASYIKIRINQINKEVVCNQENEVIVLDNVLDNIRGNITCPSNFEQFCNYYPICKNYCSSRGICVNGFCICNRGYANDDCSIKCPLFSENGIYQCVQECPIETFADLNTRVCGWCQVGCLKCQSESFCIECDFQFGYRLVQNKCEFLNF
ncbi:leishmanolysin family protein, putative [Ichthyophthirius multifiliis]|uniref:Leishmanolysin family protein, putative n=1 Tax=Ichthyophthirius multifiliis TaxID=5932 RepID=G0QVF3_ICHMU|nr:leishmanolysin family protein, putative [Ichthyophthirius multifiliis]EGR30810.1 leishmanolysin family protein, putative [Ichthyophthirius multifiliis]|eukprot:XP_004032397.1 leishmanolysin family protein, putative [Ichthyophthirius multifiliis]